MSTATSLRSIGLKLFIHRKEVLAKQDSKCSGNWCSPRLERSISRSSTIQRSRKIPTLITFRQKHPTARWTSTVRKCARCRFERIPTLTFTTPARWQRRNSSGEIRLISSTRARGRIKVRRKVEHRRNKVQDPLLPRRHRVRTPHQMRVMIRPMAMHHQKEKEKEKLGAPRLRLHMFSQTRGGIPVIGGNPKNNNQPRIGLKKNGETTSGRSSNVDAEPE